MQSLGWRSILTLVILVLTVIFALPSVPGVANSPLSKFLPGNAINLGLDLKGGIHLTLGVDMQAAMQNNLTRLADDLKATAREDEIYVLRPTVQNERISMTLVSADKQDAFDQLVENMNVLVTDSATVTADNKVNYVFSVLSQYRKNQEELVMAQAIKTIRNRIDQFGVTEPEIRKQSGNRIQVQLPGLQDPERAIKIIGQTAHLDFMIVDDTADVAKAQQGVLGPNQVLSTLMNKLPNGEYSESPIVLRKGAVLTGEYITDAQVRNNQFNEWYVSLNFNNRGGTLFARITGENVGKRLAIVLDGKVFSAPTIQEQITGGRASITGRFTKEEAADLAVVLRAGSLPAPIKILEQRSVGPSLGQESIDKGVNAALIGMGIVLVFMLIYYGFGGMVADLMLMFNIVLIVAILAAFGGTLTLPGIAGIILTIGMAVDGNVIIFERIREEVRRGLSPRAAVSEGFGRAFWTIFDANVTTIIAAVILFQFGTGPIKGFALTLGVGIVTSMFTAIFVSRLLFDLYLKKKPETAKLSI